MSMLNEVGRGVMGGGSRRAALWAGLSWKHADVQRFAHLKDWHPKVRELKEENFSFPATLDLTNISVMLDQDFFDSYHNGEASRNSVAHAVYWETMRRALKTGEPGFAVSLDSEILRNPCGELTSADDSDVCCLASINMARIESVCEFRHVMEVAIAFLVAGTVYSEVPYHQVDTVKRKNRRLGLGLTGLHEWLLVRGKAYGPDPDLQVYLEAYAGSTPVAAKWADTWSLSRPCKTRAIAPTGTLSIIAETSSGIEPVFCVAYKRRYLKGESWNYQYVVDPVAQRLIEGGMHPSNIEDSYTLSRDIERRVGFQAWVQQYVDHAISSTLNLPAWGSPENNEDTVDKIGQIILKYLPKLKGLTMYPENGRGKGQPLVPVSYATAVKHLGEVFLEGSNVCSITGRGSCGE
jgi:ribonucleoside-diphosphate reductase alpha chain